MASTRRDEEGWRSRVQYMRETMGFSLARVTDVEAARMTSYMNALFGEDSVLPPSPASMPEYSSLVKSFSDDAMNIVYVEYDLPGPNRMPWSAAPDKSGNVWMPYYGKANMIGRWIPKLARSRNSRFLHKAPPQSIPYFPRPMAVSGSRNSD